MVYESPRAKYLMAIAGYGLVFSLQEKNTPIVTEITIKEKSLE